MKKLSHLNAKGKARMVDVGSKPVQKRTAIAEGFIKLNDETLQKIRENLLKKGDVLGISEFAGIQGGKKCSELIPLCHPLNLTSLDVEASLEKNAVKIVSTARCKGQTGVEMEALTAVSVALLTIYDMCKAIDKEMSLYGIRLIHKEKTN